MAYPPRSSTSEPPHLEARLRVLDACEALLTLLRQRVQDPVALHQVSVLNPVGVPGIELGHPWHRPVELLVSVTSFQCK